MTLCGKTKPLWVTYSFGKSTILLNVKTGKITTKYLGQDKLAKYRTRFLLDILKISRESIQSKILQILIFKTISEILIHFVFIFYKAEKNRRKRCLEVDKTTKSIRLRSCYNHKILQSKQLITK